MSVRTMRLTAVAATLAFVAACGGGPELETRTFQLQYLRSGEASSIIQPYVYPGRDGAPGMLSSTGQTVTVRELPENLDRIAAVLEEYDRPPPTVRLRFQIIEADGFSDSDPEIAEIEAELRDLFNFRGYRLAASTVLETLEGGGVSQTVGGLGYAISGNVHQVRRTDEGGFLTMDVGIQNLFHTTVRIPLGETVVLGSGRIPWAPDSEVEAAILVVTPEISG